MPKIITVANQKGGVGKSTFAINLLHALKSHVNAKLVDVDPQGTSIETAALRKTFDVTPYSSGLQTLDCDIVIVDTPPYLSVNLDEIFAVSDLVIVPTKSSLADVLSMRRTVGLIRNAQVKKPGLKAAVVYNMVKHGTSLTDEVRQQVEDTFHIPSFKTLIYDRANYTRSIAVDGGVYGLMDGKLEKEFDAFVKEILIALQTENYFAPIPMD